VFPKSDYRNVESVLFTCSETQPWVLRILLPEIRMKRLPCVRYHFSRGQMRFVDICLCSYCGSNVQEVG
jgi:hypothetical protein